MDYDIEQTIEDNVRLKKALQMLRFSAQKTEKQLKEIKQIYEEQIQKNKSLKNDFCELQRKYQQSYTESIKDSNALISQIEDLKKIIEEKQRDMQQIQIKLIPSLDQDMLRVKLIAQMQGPYQQMIDIKDREIDRLKSRVSELQRNLQISSLSQKSKVGQLKRQNQEMKRRYEEQTSRLMQELNLALSRYESQSAEASIIKNQKKEIQQLKLTIQFVSLNEQKNIEEIKDLKEQRKNLLQKLMAYNSRQALLLEGKHNLNEVEKLREERLKQVRQIESLKSEKDKLSRQVVKLESEKDKLINEHQKQLSWERSKLMNEKNQLNFQISNLREEIRLARNLKIEGETQRQTNYQKIKMLEKDLYQKGRQLQALKLKSSRIAQKQTNVGYSTESTGGAKLIQQTHKQQEQQRKQNDQTRINYKKWELKENARVNELKGQNEKLKRKLGQANEKIMQLIRDKMKLGLNFSPQRDRTKINLEKPQGVFLEYQDCAFTPIIEPTLYRYPPSAC